MPFCSAINVSFRMGIEKWTLDDGGEVLEQSLTEPFVNDYEYFPGIIRIPSNYLQLECPTMFNDSSSFDTTERFQNLNTIL